MLPIVAEVTFSVAVPLTGPDVAVIVTLEATALPVTTPLAFTGAEPGTEELHEAEVVMSWVLPSLKVAMAVNCCVLPLAMLATDGVTLMLCKVAETTVIDVLSQTFPTQALTFALPALMPDATPEFEIVATALLSEPHATPMVRSWLVPSLKIPVAVNCCAPPAGMVGMYGEIVIELRFAEVTCKVPCADIPLKVAEMLEVPLATLCAKPDWTVATLVLDEDHAARLVRSCWLLSE